MPRRGDYLPLGNWLTRHHPRLGHAPRAVYVAIAQLGNAGNQRPTKREIHGACGYGLTAIDEAVRHLRATGFLRLEAHVGGPNLYTLLRGPWLDGEPANDVTPVDNSMGEGVPPPPAGGTPPPAARPPFKSSPKEDLKEQQRPPPFDSSPSRESERPRPKGLVRAAPPIELDDLSRARLLRLPLGAECLAMLASAAARAEPVLYRRALDRLLAKDPAYVTTGPGLLQVLLRDQRVISELEAAGLATPPPETAKQTPSRPHVPDPDTALIEGLRSRLEIIPPTHKHRAMYEAQLAAALQRRHGAMEVCS